MPSAARHLLRAPQLHTCHSERSEASAFDQYSCMRCSAFVTQSEAKGLSSRAKRPIQVTCTSPPRPMCVSRTQRLAAEASTPALRNSRRPRKSGFTTSTLSSAPSCSHVGHARIPTPPSQGGQCRPGHGAGSETRVSFANVKHTSWLKAARP